VFWKKKVQLGVDLGSYALKVCCLDRSGTTCTVSHVPMVAQRQSKEDDLNPAQLGALACQHIERVAREAGRSTPKIHLSLEDATAATGYVEVPRLTREQLKLALPTAVARDIPYTLAEVDLYPFEVPALHKSDHLGYFFLAIPKATLVARKGLFAQGGLEVASCEPGVLALVRGLARNHTIPSEECSLVVVCGFRTTHVILLSGGKPYFSRDFGMAGADFTYAFQMGDQVDWNQAEQSKLDYHVGERDFKVESFIQRWLTEIQRSLKFARQRFPMLHPGQVILTGGTALWRGLDERLSEALGLPVRVEQWHQLQPSSSSGPAEIVFYQQALGLVTP
jgi:type IV pilus assembly protein PilM